MLNYKVLLNCFLLPAILGATLHDTGDEKAVSQRDDIQAALKIISERLDRWDEFYMGRLEPRMVGAATPLANLDTNIRNLQERAHVWDTFQLHVSAWNDQIKALDHKMNIINEGYEKLQSLDSMFFSALKPNGSLRNIESRLNHLDEKVDNVAQGLVKESNAPIVHEFAGRGVLHTLKIVERKLDRIQMVIDRTASLEKLENHEDVETINIKCMTSSQMEELLRDVSSKVDTIFDQNYESDVEGSNSVDVRHMGRACKKLMVPQKKLQSTIEYLRNVIQELVGEEPTNSQKSLGLRNRRRLRDLDEVKDTLEDIERGISNLGKQQDRNINENEKILRRLERKIDAVTKDDENDDDLVVNRLKRLETLIKKALERKNDDSDEDRRDRKKTDDTDEDSDDSDNGSDDDEDDDDDDDDDGKHSKKGKNDNNDTDEDSDDDERHKHRHSKKRKHDSNDDDTDEDDDSDDDDDKRNKKRKQDSNDDDTDEDDDSDDDDDRHSKKRNKQDSNDDDTDEDDDSDDDDENEGRKGSIRRRLDKRQTVPPVVNEDKHEESTMTVSQSGESATATSVVQKLLSFTQQQ